ncbi:MAG: DUF2914 domain-containing protein [Alphaproteobacteria bacterium]|nr:DUF2914 domain-containing protein [Alphaproteobacteria bacterium]MDE2112252.1 DUF2914 domain-containing protein [Alphaproteobacteria bacterium]
MASPSSLPQTGTSMIAWFQALKSYQRHLSAAAMAGGFAFDNVAYGRVDHPVTQTLLLVYLLVAAASIVLLHYLHAFPEIDGFRAKLRGYLPAVTQFAFGSLWSAFLVFYARSGVLAGSWPFLIVLAAIFIGNEVFRDYHARLLFTSGLFFFALLSYAIFMVPVFTHTIGAQTFVLSGVAAAAVFLLFVRLLNWVSAERLGQVKWQIRFAGLAVFAAVFGLYFLNLLPPLPLALQKAGVFHSVKHLGPVYYGMTEEQSWTTYLGFPPVIHVEGREPVYVFCAIFAPIDLATTIVHRWQHYDASTGQWDDVQSVSYRISGGRGKGYRGYTKKTAPEPGLWRVDIDMVDGRLIGRQEFVVVNGPAPPAKLTTVLD